jgi:hypothetical protein
LIKVAPHQAGGLIDLPCYRLKFDGHVHIFSREVVVDQEGEAVARPIGACLRQDLLSAWSSGILLNYPGARSATSCQSSRETPRGSAYFGRIKIQGDFSSGLRLSQDGSGQERSADDECYHHLHALALIVSFSIRYLQGSARAILPFAVAVFPLTLSLSKGAQSWITLK